MLALIVVWWVVVLWMVSHGVFIQKRHEEHRRRRTVMTWVLVGACIGSLAGFSGVLPAFAGALLGAFIAWQVARRIGPKRPADGREQLLKP